VIIAATLFTKTERHEGSARASWRQLSEVKVGLLLEPTLATKPENTKTKSTRDDECDQAAGAAGK
jgi:hypothetical protein